jgi:hypothetical protein
MTAPRTFTQWRHLADCVILNRTTDDQAARAELLDRIARTCLDIEAQGGVASVWHASSIVSGHRCNCVPCRASLKA